MIVVYSKENCTFCEKAKHLLTVKGYEWDEYKLDKDFNREEFMEMFPSARSFPQVVELGKGNIGGFDDLEKWLATKELSL